MSSPANERVETVTSGDLQPLFMQAVARHQQGQLDEAAAIYAGILARQPRHFDAMHLLGVVALQSGRLAEAQRLIGAAIDINPLEPAALGNLGTSYLRDGQLALALHWFDIARRLQPDSVAALMNAATTLHLVGRHGSAVALLRAQPTSQERSYEVQELLGICLLESGRPDEAAVAFEAALGLQPDNPECWANLGAALEAGGEQARARECARKAKGRRPRFGAGPAAPAAAGSDPDVPMLLASAHVLLANGLNEDAVAHLQRALTLDDRSLVIRWVIANATLKAVYRSVAELEASRQAFSASLEEVRAWYEAVGEPLAAHAVVGTIQPFFLVYQPYANRELLSRCGSLCASWMTTLPRRKPAPPANGAARGDRLRLGIVSSHLREHSVWDAITKGWVQQLDRSKIELHLFHLSDVVDGETEEARRAAAVFESGHGDVRGWIEAIERSSLDALIYPEIGMDPLTLKLAAVRLAPWQAVTWGHPETSGLPTIDAYLSSQLMEPADADANYRETLVRLPNLGVYCEPLAPQVADPDLASLNLPGDEPLLLCPGSPFKYSPCYDEVWVQIAKGLRRRLFRRGSGGRLVFFRSKTAAVDRVLETRLRAAFAAGGVDFDARVSIVPFVDRSRFFGLMQVSALMLDTPGFSGFNTALQAAEGGLPMLAFDGEFLRGRLASGVMRRLELPELIAATKEEFIDKALSLVAQPAKLGELRRQIVERRGVLFRDRSPVRALEEYLLATVPGVNRGSGG